MLTVFLRSLILYSVVVIMTRIMGKRQIGQLQPFEFVITLLIADLAASPVNNIEIPLLYGVIPVLSMFLAHNALSFISLKSEKLRGIICGRPSILVANGKINRTELKNLNYNLNDLIEQLRAKGHFDFSNIDYAILETNGDISVLERQTGQKPPILGLPLAVILDGSLNTANLMRIKHDKKWLLQQLKNLGYDSEKEVFIAVIDEKDNMFVQGMEESNRVVAI